MSPLTLALAAAFLACSVQAVAQVPPAANTLPMGGQVVAGHASINAAGSNTLTIQQQSQNAAINWQSFNIGTAASVSFVQPSASAITLNRVLGQDPTQVLGNLSANGQVFILNPNGVLFGKGAQVNVGGLVASTLGLGDADFMAGRYSFSNGGSGGSVGNFGDIVANGGYVAFLGSQVSNAGNIYASSGNVSLAAGDRVILSINGTRLVGLSVDAGTVGALAENKGLIQAGGGAVLLTAKAMDALVRSVVNNQGAIEANTLAEVNGTIRLIADQIDNAGTITAAAGSVTLNAASVFHSGSISTSSADAAGGSVSVTASEVILADGAISASGTAGGGVTLDAPRVGNSALVDVRGSSGPGGTIALLAGQIVQSQGAQLAADGATQGGNIRLQGHNADGTGVIFTSGTLTATGNTGGNITLSADSTNLQAATLDASGATQGGSINVGAGWQGAPLADRRAPSITLPLGDTLTANAYTTLRADATGLGNGGEITLWSGTTTSVDGTLSARGGPLGGNGGRAEVSSKDSASFGGSADLSASAGSAGQLLLDPRNIVIGGSVAPTGAETALSSIMLANPDPVPGNRHGSGGATVLPNGNIVVDSYQDNFVADFAGAVYFYNGTTGALISSLRGSTASDSVGAGGITVLANGNFVVSSFQWANAQGFAGAVTWGSGTTGVSGVVSPANSLVGSSAGDAVGNVFALANGNYVVASAAWHSGGAAGVGAVTWGDGTKGVTGAISAANSLVGSAAGDFTGTRVTPLANGNYVVSSRLGTLGAVTWADGSTGISGTVSTANSLVGSNAGDMIGIGGVTALANGDYIVASPSWGSDSATPRVGAVTWLDGKSAITGAVSAANSLTGTATGDQVGSGGITVLNNGNYLVLSPSWRNGGADGAGAVTWASGSAATAGAVSTANSLVGSTSSDGVGTLATALANGNFVVTSPNWNNGMGAATWGDGSTGITGIVSAANSLVGTVSGDQVGNLGVTALVNGNYAVQSSAWHMSSGAVSWGDGTQGTTGAVDATNSLVGTQPSEGVGSGAVIPLTNGNYVVSSPRWNNGSITWAGAATWGDGSKGVVGTISSSNSLIGTAMNDLVGNNTVALSNGNYVVASPEWNGFTGAVTWGNGSSGSHGVVSGVNSLVGSTNNENIGIAGVTALTNGNYVVSSPGWSSNTGAVTWGDGATGITGFITSSNSLIGTAAAPFPVTALPNGDYVVTNPRYDSSLGAVTWGNGATGITGTINSSNSVIGTPGLALGSTGVVPLTGDRFIVMSASNIVGGDVRIVSVGPSFGAAPDTDVTLSASTLAQTLATGTNVTLQANNDITLSGAVSVQGSRGGDLTLQAGRSIVFNSSVTTGDGSLTARADDPGALAAYRDAGSGDIVIAPGAVINAGTGTLQLAGRRFINLSGAGALRNSGDGRWLVWSANPAADFTSGLVSSFMQYDASFGITALPPRSAGNGFFYSGPPSSARAAGISDILGSLYTTQAQHQTPPLQTADNGGTRSVTVTGPGVKLPPGVQ